MKAIAKQLTNAARVLRSFTKVTSAMHGSGPITVYVKKGEAVYLRKEKP